MGWGGLAPGSLVLVDTAPIIYVLEDHPQWAKPFVGLFEAAAQGQLHIAISTVTLAEVLTGPYKAGQPALAQRYRQALDAYLLQALTPAIAALSAQMRAQYRLKLPDAVQLATAIDMGATALVTQDRDFSGVLGIRIIDGKELIQA